MEYRQSHIQLNGFVKKKCVGLNRELNPGPPAPEAGIIRLDH